MRFDLAHLLSIDEANPGDAVLLGSIGDLFEAVGFVGVLRDHQLTALPVWDAAFGHVWDQQLDTSAGERRLERPRLLVEPGIHDSRGVPALVRGDVLGLVEHGHLGIGEPAGDLPGECRADDPGAHYGHS